MRKILFLLGLITLFVVPIAAQDEEICSADDINDEIGTLVVTYLADRAEDDAGAYADAETLAADISAVLENCGEVATSEDAPESSDTASSDGLPREGKWMIHWQLAESVCPNGTTISGIDRPFIMTVDRENDVITADDILIWPPLEFTPDVEGIYRFGRNGATFTYDYILEDMSEDRIAGVIRNFIPSINCNLESEFTMTLVDENIQCLVATEFGANLRSGPGTDFNRAGTLAADERTDVIGQAIGSDSFVWWQLDNEAWVRSDVVQEAGYCDDVAQVES